MVYSCRIKRQFAPHTRNAFGSLIKGYVELEAELSDHIENTKEKWGLDRVFRFDLGQNNDGCAPQVAKRFQEQIQTIEVGEYLKNYPSNRFGSLKEKIGQLHGVSKNWVMLSAGIEQMIALIANTFFEINDKVLLTRPTFFVFENFSRRIGALPIYLDLYEGDDFNFTAKTFEKFRMLMRHHRPKIVWIASPNNPTGLSLPDEFVPQIVREAGRIDSMVVFDEAFGEYVDPPGGVKSASRLLQQHPHLIVMRTFSKAYGLANIRLGYAMTGNEDVLAALRMHSANYPFGQFSLELAESAMKELDYLEVTRQNTRDRRHRFFSALRNCSFVTAIPSDCNTIMLRHHGFSAAQVTAFLERNGIFTARIPGQGEIGNHYIRVTLGNVEMNQILIDNLANIQRTKKSCLSFVEKNSRWGEWALEGQQ